MLAWLVLFVPTIYPTSVFASPAVPLVQILVAGVVLGIGRQGVDLLALRVIIAAIALPAGWLVGAHSATCGSLVCVQGRLVGGAFIVLLTALSLGLVAVPTTLLWNRASVGLRPEFAWTALPRPRTWWQWALVILAIVAVAYLGPVLLGIPPY